MTAFNVFRIIGDLSHVSSKIILLWSIHWNRSAEGVSLITQVLYILVFLTRYLDLFDKPVVWWNFIFKLFYIASSAYIVFLMAFVYARTREREKAWKFGLYCLGGAILLALPMQKSFQKGPQVTRKGTEGPNYLWSHPFTFKELCWVFSEILESVAVLPQLVLLRQTTVPTVIDSYYLLCLGSYRGFYIINWILRVADPKDRYFDPISTLFGIIQTALYLDFFWVYYSRQRVKLRAGGIVDSDDFQRGWLVGRIVGKQRAVDEEDGAAHETHNGRPKNRWGTRGISVSADETLHDVDADDARPLTDPTAFEDELSDDEGAPAAANGTEAAPVDSPWNDEEGDSSGK